MCLRAILGPLLFLIFINDLPQNVDAKLVLFADDTTAIVDQKSEDLEAAALKVISDMSQWFKHNGLQLNAAKTTFMHFQTVKHNNVPELQLQLSGECCDSTDCVSFLGVRLESSLKWKSQVSQLENKLNKALFAIRTLRRSTDLQTSLIVYHSYFLSLVRYSIIFWGSYKTQIDRIFIKQKEVIRILYNLSYRESCRPHFIRNGLLSVPAIFIYEIISFLKINPNYFDKYKMSHHYGTRNRNDFQLPPHRLNLFERSPLYKGLKFFNALPNHIKSESTTDGFLKKLKSFLIERCPYRVEDITDI